MHTSKQMNIYLHVTSYPIIEDCNHINFAPYTLSISGLDEMFKVNIYLFRIKKTEIISEIFS